MQNLPGPALGRTRLLPPSAGRLVALYGPTFVCRRRRSFLAVAVTFWSTRLQLGRSNNDLQRATTKKTTKASCRFKLAHAERSDAGPFQSFYLNRLCNVPPPSEESHIAHLQASAREAFALPPSSCQPWLRLHLAISILPTVVTISSSAAHGPFVQYLSSAPRETLETLDEAPKT